MFSLEGPLGRRFLTRSRLFDAAERAELGLPDPERPVYACVGDSGV